MLSLLFASIFAMSALQLTQQLLVVEFAYYRSHGLLNCLPHTTLLQHSLAHSIHFSHQRHHHITLDDHTTSYESRNPYMMCLSLVYVPSSNALTRSLTLCLIALSRFSQRLPFVSLCRVSARWPRVSGTDPNHSFPGVVVLLFAPLCHCHYLHHNCMVDCLLLPLGAPTDTSSFDDDVLLMAYEPTYLTHKLI